MLVPCWTSCLSGSCRRTTSSSDLQWQKSSALLASRLENEWPLYGCVTSMSAPHTHGTLPPQQSSCFLLVEKFRWLPLISPLVSDHLPGSAAALWRSTGISLWLNETFHHNERTKLVHCVAVLAQNIIKNLSLYISSFPGVFFFLTTLSFKGCAN